MSKIDYKIEEDNFSKIPKMIAEILLVEFCKQIELKNDFLPNEVYYDTDYTPDEGNIPWVAVNWLNYDNTIDNRASSQNLNRYFIDVKNTSYETVRKTISVIRKILKSEHYITLDFVDGIISNTNIIEAGVSFEEQLRDSQGTISGGVTYQCNVFETNDVPEGTPLVQSTYESVINESDKKLTLKNIY